MRASSSTQAPHCHVDETEDIIEGFSEIMFCYKGLIGMYGRAKREVN